VADDVSNPLEEILRFHAEKFRDAPYAGRVARLVRTAKHIPAPLISDLEALIPQLDVELVGNDLSIAIVEVAFCDEKVGDATDLAAAMRSRLRRYLKHPEVAASAREFLKERVGWWVMALGRAFQVKRWPPLQAVELQLAELPTPQHFKSE
jgi:hypothetical protein